MNIWPVTKRPSGVALLVATKALQWSPFPAFSISSSAFRKLRPLRGVGATRRPSSRALKSMALLRVAMSRRSSFRPFQVTPALATPAAMPFISSRYSGSNFRSIRASAIVRRWSQPFSGLALSCWIASLSR